MFEQKMEFTVSDLNACSQKRSGGTFSLDSTHIGAATSGCPYGGQVPADPDDGDGCRCLSTARWTHRSGMYGANSI